MDWISIEDLEVRFRVGVPEEERREPQRLLVSVRIGHDFSIAARTDDLNATIDYFAVTQRIKALGEGREWKLIEKLVVEIAELILAEFGARTVEATVKKFIIPETRWVAVGVSRRREE